MIKLNSRGDSEVPGELMKLLLILVVIITLVFIARAIFLNQDFTGRTDLRVCKESVRANAFRIYEGFDFAVSKIRCPPTEVVIKDKEREKIFKRIADAQYECWDKFGEGKLSLFQVPRGGEEHFCVICSYITFQGEARGQELKNYTAYLVTHKIPRPGDGRSYWEFLTYQRPSKLTLQEPEMVELLRNHTINTSQDYVLLFHYAKNKTYWDKYLVAAVAGIASGVGAFIAGVVTIGVTGGVGSVAGALTAIKGITLVTAAAGSLAAAGGLMYGGNLEIDWISGVELRPFIERSFVELNCTRLEG